MINVKTRYGSQAGNVSTNYPYGSFINDSTPGDNTGTPLEAAWPNDIQGFLAAMLARSEVSVTPNNVIDTAQSSQILTALIQLIDGRANALINARFTVGGASGSRTLDIDTSE